MPVLISKDEIAPFGIQGTDRLSVTKPLCRSDDVKTNLLHQKTTFKTTPEGRFLRILLHVTV
jgi:hypothetical protein